MLYRDEKQGLVVLLLVVVALFVVPRVMRGRETAHFLVCEAHSLADSMPPAYVEEARKIELNTADSVALMQVKGIGAYYARKIIRYRERLGGYCKISQLKELNLTYLDVDSVASQFTVDASLIRKSDFDKMEFKEVLRHPYLEYEDVCLIFNARRKYGSINVDNLSKHGILPAHKVKRIRPYFR